jgi:hypothetical protein
MRRILALVGAVALVSAVVAGLWLWRAGPDARARACVRLGICEDTSEVLGTALASVRRQQQLVVLSARLVTALSAVDQRSLFGVGIASARKTMIVPATVRYAVDLRRLRPSDLRWDAGARTLTVRRPPLLLLGPEVDLARTREFVDGKFLLALTGTEADLDRINRSEARGRLLAEARQPALMDLAAAAADQALARTFELPLRAAGFAPVQVVVERADR